MMALVVKYLPAKAGDVRDVGSVPGWGRSPEGGQGNSLQYSCLENPMDTGACWAMVNRVTKCQTWLKWLSKHSEGWGGPTLIIAHEPQGCVLCCTQLLQSCLTLWHPMNCSLPGSSVHGDFPGKNTGEGYIALLQGIFLTQRSNLSLLHYRQTFYTLSYLGSSRPQEVWVKPI